jgi:spermidine/putrescine transport system substrate-binding protein
MRQKFYKAVLVAGALGMMSLFSLILPGKISLAATGTSAEEVTQTASIPVSEAVTSSQAGSVMTSGADSGRDITLRICNWEEYMDEGGWDADETIDLPSGDIIGQNSMIEDFENWYKETYGVNVHVEYSTFGTNEDLYNMLTLGDTYDLICPSEYMFMKLISEGQVVPLSEHFFDASDPDNFYIRGVSPYLRRIFEEHSINGEPWSRYAAGYMWGVTGIVYNPELVTREQASTWNILRNPEFRKRVTIKDSVRECYFAAVAALKGEELTSPSFREDPEYKKKLEQAVNDTSPEMIRKVQDWLQDMKDNVYSFEVDSGKADMVTGKVAANYQWSGDAVYTMDQAEADNYYLEFVEPEEASNIYFDGWIMLKRGIQGDPAKQQAAEAFINFVSRPDNAIRNMYYIGYTSFISGGEDPRIFEYLKWNYGADEDSKDTVDYDVSYFFTGNDDAVDPRYVLTVPEEQTRRQLGAQYPSTEDIRRTSIMQYFDDAQNQAINRMWVNVRCYNIRHLPWWGWCVIAAGLAGTIYAFVLKYRIRKKMEP